MSGTQARSLSPYQGASLLHSQENTAGHASWLALTNT